MSVVGRGRELRIEEKRGGKRSSLIFFVFLFSFFL
jgi:hypothetical protein